MVVISTPGSQQKFTEGHTSGTHNVTEQPPLYGESSGNRVSNSPSLNLVVVLLASASLALGSLIMHLHVF